MAAPSKSFTVIANTAIDPDSPVTEGLMTALRDNDINLQEWLGKNYTPTVDHDHDGTNSARVALSSLTTQLTVDASGAAWTVSTGALGFDPQAMVIDWAFTDGTYYYTGHGMYNGTTQNGTSHNVVGAITIDANNIMGYTAGPVPAIGTSFVSEQASVTAFSASNITIATQSGAWTGGTTLYINLQVWGS